MSQPRSRAASDPAVTLRGDGPGPAQIRPLEVVFFDLGGTLWQSAWPTSDDVARHVLPGVAARLRRIGLEDPVPASLAHALLQQIRAADAHACASDCVSPDFHAVVTLYLRAQHGLTLDRPEAEAILDALQLEGRTIERRLYPDSTPSLEAVSAMGFRMGCITNRFFAGQPLRRSLHALGLDRYLEVIAASCEVGFLKPHPAIYEWALREMGVEASEAIMVGDSLRADVEGAHAAGMRSVWLCREPVSPPSGSAVSAPTIGTLAELPALLAAW